MKILITAKMVALLTKLLQQTSLRIMREATLSSFPVRTVLQIMTKHAVCRKRMLM